jgi:hypothetical protein
LHSHAGVHGREFFQIRFHRHSGDDHELRK